MVGSHAAGSYAAKRHKIRNDMENSVVESTATEGDTFDYFILNGFHVRKKIKGQRFRALTDFFYSAFQFGVSQHR